ncbi:5879_t:CDS:1, partial [Scutellospora calospora]
IHLKNRLGVKENSNEAGRLFKKISQVIQNTTKLLGWRFPNLVPIRNFGI